MKDEGRRASPFHPPSFTREQNRLSLSRPRGQTVGMGRQLSESLPAARALVRAGQCACWTTIWRRFASTARRSCSIRRCIASRLCLSLAWRRLESLKAKSPEVVENCQAAAGLSLGEYTALVFAGVMDFEVGLKVVQERGSAMQAAADLRAQRHGQHSGTRIGRRSRLSAPGGPRRTVASGQLALPGKHCRSGTKAACARIAEMAPAAGAMRAIPLAVAGAFHTPIMQPAVERLTGGIGRRPAAKAADSGFSNVDARAARRSGRNPPSAGPASGQSGALGRFLATGLLALGCDEFYEVGPGRVLRGLLKRIDRRWCLATEDAGLKDERSKDELTDAGRMSERERDFEIRRLKSQCCQAAA